MAIDTNDADDEKSTDSEQPEYVARTASDLRAEADMVANTLHELADAVEAGDADAEQVDRAVRVWSTLFVAIEDAADISDVIDPFGARYRAIGRAQTVIYRAAVGDTQRALDAAGDTLTAAHLARKQDIESDGGDA